jgi:hypothetical protein
MLSSRRASRFDVEPSYATRQAQNVVKGLTMFTQATACALLAQSEGLRATSTESEKNPTRSD